MAFGAPISSTESTSEISVPAITFFGFGSSYAKAKGYFIYSISF
tara:strand:- start:305 stop:436 length:132 start_codon:yes stop_codon:yes gene_type:complete